MTVLCAGGAFQNRDAVACQTAHRLDSLRYGKPDRGVLRPVAQHDRTAERRQDIFDRHGGLAVSRRGNDRDIALPTRGRAAAQGYDCRFTVTMATDESGILQVDRVTVHCGADDIAHLREIQELVTSECGVPAERQEVIAR